MDSEVSESFDVEEEEIKTESSVEKDKINGSELENNEINDVLEEIEEVKEANRNDNHA